MEQSRKCKLTALRPYIFCVASFLNAFFTTGSASVDWHKYFYYLNNQFKKEPVELVKEEKALPCPNKIQKENFNHILSSISLFEGSNKRGYATVSRTDGISLGLLQLNVNPRAQTLNNAVRYMLNTHPEVSKEVLGSDFGIIQNLFSRPPNEISDFFRRRANYNRHYNSLVHLIGRTEEGRAYQDRDADQRKQQAMSTIKKHGFSSVRAKKYAFDKKVLFGATGTRDMFKVTKGVNRNQINTERLFDNYFRNKFASAYHGNGHDFNEFMRAKRDFITSLDRDTLIDFYKLNLIDDELVKRGIHDRRGRGILGLSGQRINNEWQHGYVVHGSFFTPDNEILNRPITPVNTLNHERNN